MVVAVVAGQEQEIDGSQVCSPVKLKSECPALGIDLALKQLAGCMVGSCRVRLMRRLWWWQARSRRSMEVGGYSPCKWKLSAGVMIPVKYISKL